MADDFLYRLIAFAGFCIFPFLAWMTGGCRRIDRKTVAGSLLLIWGIGILTFWLPWSRQFLGWINDVLVAILAASQKGTIFLFGPLALGPGADPCRWNFLDWIYPGDTNTAIRDLFFGLGLGFVLSKHYAENRAIFCQDIRPLFETFWSGVFGGGGKYFCRH